MEYKHTINVQKDAWFIRLYCWLWEASAEQINLCKLFWGYVFFFPGLFIYLVLVVPGRRIGDWYNDRKAASDLSPKYKTKEKKEHPIMQRILGGISFFFAKVASIASAFWYQVSRHKRFNYYLSRVIIGLGALISIVAIGFALFLAVKYVTVTAIAFGILIAAFTAVIGILFLNTVGFFSFTKKKASGFFSVLFAGLKAVKSNTCPEIKVID